MSKPGNPAEGFCPGKFIRDELKARGWTQNDLAQMSGLPRVTVNQIINGRKSITARTAASLADVFGTSPKIWLNLQAVWDMWREQ